MDSFFWFVIIGLAVALSGYIRVQRREKLHQVYRRKVLTNRLKQECDLLLETTRLLQESGLSHRQQHSILLQLNELQEEFQSAVWQAGIGAENAEMNANKLIAKSRQFRQTFAS